MRLSAPAPFRSAVPLAAAGIACLGLVPTLGGPERPLHWAMTAGMVGFGMLLWARHRVQGAEAPLASVPVPVARQAGRALLFTCAVSTLLVLGIIGLQLRRGGGVSALSVALPAAGLAWLTSLAFKTLRLREAAPPMGTDRASRRPPNWDGLQSSSAAQSTPTNHHARV